MPTVTQVTTEARKPFYATVGLGQLAVDRARTLPKTVPAELTKLQDQAIAQVKTLPSIVTSLPSQAATLPTQVRTSVKTQLDTASTKATEFSGKAEGIYTDLVARGAALVGKVRGQQSTKVAEAAVKQTVRSAKATATSAKKAVKATETAGQDASKKV